MSNTPDFFAEVTRRFGVDYNDFRFEFDENGTLHQRGRNGWREPMCFKCREPVRWVLDMASFVNDGTGGFALAHARCAWTREAFIREARRAPK